MARPLLIALLYVLFFLSGAAALVYQVVWVRSLTLVFGGTHLAVTAVLSIFMTGLAIGGYAIGRYVDRIEKPLRLYAWLELGIAASALAFAALMAIYPAIYVSLARGRDSATMYLLAVRLLFSFVALIVPTTLMGGTLPVLSRFVSRQPESLRSHLSFLYGCNTLGAVLGAVAAGFFLLRTYTVSTTLFVAIATNAIIGAVCLALGEGDVTGAVPAGSGASAGVPGRHDARRTAAAATLVLWGIGLSGFCALGYEVLWTRVLTIGIGASVYGFTIILVAFLTGIALGSAAYGLFAKAFSDTRTGTSRAIVLFGLTEVLIGITAFLVTVYLREIPANSVRLQGYVLGTNPVSFPVRVWANFALAFAYTVVPAVFMGAAFPLAGEIVAAHRRAVGRAVGDVLASNTVGAILGAAASGLVMIQVFGIERSLQLLAVLNVGVGGLVLASLRGRRVLPAAVGALGLAIVAVLAVDRDVARIWDTNYFAIFRSNQPDAFRTPEMVREAVENTDVLYYAEGIESIVSVIRVKGGEQAFITNGRVEASTHLQAQQNQFALGHLPMLLHPHPREVLVVGMGSGMTAGATAVHPSVDRVTLVELEPKVLGVARTFADYNHGVVDHPKVNIVINDGRNFLTTTAATFDVITADPIHPWFKGAGYLYSSQYFALAAAHLRPGGVIAQWLPIYELTPRDLASVVRTFREHFPHTLLWLTHYDAQILGSNAPFAIDEARLDRRIAEPSIAADLRRVAMGSAADLLSYFVMGTEGMERFAREGVVNTDDNLYLEFAAPFSIASPAVMAANVDALTAHRESIVPYLSAIDDPAVRAERSERWSRQLAAAEVGDRALGSFLAGRTGEPAFTRMIGELARRYPAYAPGHFLQMEYLAMVAMEPRLIQQSSFTVVNDDGATTKVLEVSAVLVPVSRTRATIMFVDNRSKSVYGQVYIDDYARNEAVVSFVGDVMDAIRAAYDQEASGALAKGKGLPPAVQTLQRLRGVIDAKVQGARLDS